MNEATAPENDLRQQTTDSTSTVAQESLLRTVFDNHIFLLCLYSFLYVYVNN